MPENRNSPLVRISALAVLLTLFAAGIVLFSLRVAGTETNHSSEPWTSAQVLQPGDLAKELSDSKNPQKPSIICVGFEALYRTAHIRGAVFQGAASSPQGLDSLKKWANGVPRTKTIVIYCGCCPFSKCPNVRPAFGALSSMGFTHLKVLSIPTDFGTDWVAKGYPTETAN
jgi:thiosulfate/3-mercaptopyruvate sulfurtransferase